MSDKAAMFAMSTLSSQHFVAPFPCFALLLTCSRSQWILILFVQIPEFFLAVSRMPVQQTKSCVVRAADAGIDEDIDKVKRKSQAGVKLEAKAKRALEPQARMPASLQPPVPLPKLPLPKSRHDATLPPPCHMLVLNSRSFT